MADALVRCGCGRIPGFGRLIEARRESGRVTCETCRAETAMRDMARRLGLAGERAEAFIARGVAWITGEAPSEGVTER